MRLPGLRRRPRGVRIRVEPRERLTLRLEGALDERTAHHVRAVVSEHWTARRALLVDLSGVTAIDAAGLALLVDLDDRCRVAPAAFVAPATASLDVSAIEDRLCWRVEGDDA